MSIKDLCFRAQSALQSQHGIAAKRSHLHEVLAALFGYGSHAALGAEAIYAQTEDGGPPATVDREVATSRAQRCGYSPSESGVVASVLEELAERERLCITTVRVVLAQIQGEDGVDRELFSDVSAGDDEPEALASSAAPQLDLDSSILKASLESAADRGSADAHLALALLLDVDEDDEDDTPAPGLDGSYWFEQMQSGRKLTGTELEWALAYQESKLRREACVRHLQQAAAGGVAEAALRLAELSRDEHTFSTALKKVAPEQAARLAEVALELGREGDALELLRTAAATGDVDAMRLLADRLRDDEEAWMWVYVAELCGHDMRRAEAIHEDGTPYDDDVGGPVFVAVEFDRPALADAADARARAQADQIFQTMRT